MGKAKRVCGAVKKHGRVEGHEPRCECTGCRCQRPAGERTNHLGIGSCYRHGGSTETHVVAAQKEILQVAAARLGVPLDVDAGEALIGLVREAAGNVEFYRRLIQELPTHPEPDDLDFDEDGKPHLSQGKTGIYGRTYHVSGIPTGEAKPNVLLALYNDERDRLKAYVVEALKAGVDERRLRLAEADATELFAGMMAAVKAAKLTPAQIEVFRRELADRLRATRPVAALGGSAVEPRAQRRPVPDTGRARKQSGSRDDPDAGSGPDRQGAGRRRGRS